jgi:hypothetical protein
MAGSKRSCVAALAAFFLLALPATAGPGITDPGDQLPDIVMAKPSQSEIKIVVENGRRLLRYSSGIKNIGAGAFELDAARFDEFSQWTVYQRIFNADGTSRQIPTQAQVVWGGDGHEHYHILDVESGELLARNGQSVGVLAKHGFCFFDDEGPTGKSLPFYTAFGCGWNRTPVFTNLTFGLSANWADTYPWFYVGQYIDITNVPPGRYTLRISASTSFGFVEADTTNNSVEVSLRL